MHFWKTIVLVPVVSLPALACAGGGSPGPGGERDANVITLAEIESTDAETAYQIVQQLRPRWMIRNRGSRTFSQSEADFAKVIVDDMPPREFDHLREIPRAAIVELRLLEPREATFLYGTGYNEGIILVKTRR